MVENGQTTVASVDVASSYTTALAGANNDLVYTAATTGLASNGITITYVDPGAPNAALSVTVAGRAITVHLATDGLSAITSTAALVAAAVGASVPATALVGVANAPANDGSGVVTAMAVQTLTGGLDAPTLLVGAKGAGTYQVYLRNRGAVSVHIGDETITTGGFELAAGGELINPITLPPGDALYAIAASSTARVDVLVLRG